MKSETALFLDKAREQMRRADIIFTAGLSEEAGRMAYLAGFHAAQALIFERRNNAPKTHRGVHAEFLRLVKDEAGIDAELRGFLGRGYNLKAIADYETGPGAHVPPETARAAMATARRLVDYIAALLPSNSDDSKP